MLPNYQEHQWETILYCYQNNHNDHPSAGKVTMKFEEKNIPKSWQPSIPPPTLRQQFLYELEVVVSLRLSK